MERHDTDQSSNDPIDFGILDELRSLQGEDEPDIVAEVVELFLEDSPRRVAAIRAAAAARDPRQLGREAHGLKGSSANVGAVHLRSLCERLERLGKSGATEGADALATAVEAEFQRVRQCLLPLIKVAS